MGYFKNIERRYSDFHTFHDMISERYKGIYIPFLPPKKTFGKNDEKFIEKRRLGLQEYLVNINSHSFLWQSDEFSTFVRT